MDTEDLLRHVSNTMKPFEMSDLCGRNSKKERQTFRLESDLMETFREVVELDDNIYKSSKKPRYTEALREAMVMYINHKLRLTTLTGEIK